MISPRSTADGPFLPTTGWLPVAGAAKVRAPREVATESAANCVTRPGYQAANVENSGDAPAGLGTDVRAPSAERLPGGFPPAPASRVDYPPESP